MAFPKPKTMLAKCERWVKMCGRKYVGVGNIRKETYICSKHFVGGKGPTDEYPDPLPASATNFEINRLSSKRKRKSPMKRKCSVSQKLKRLVFPDAIDHPYSVTDSTPSVADKVLPTDTQCEEDELNILGPLMTVTESVLDCQEEIVSINPQYVIDTHVQTDSKEMVTTSVQTEVCYDDLAYMDSEIKDRKNVQRRLFLDPVLKNDDSCKFYTGLNLCIFTMLFSWLGAKAATFNYWRGQDTTNTKANQKLKPGPGRKLSLKEEFLLTLIRLRRGLDVEVLGDLFGVHPSNISRILITWINFLFLELNFLITWPTKEQVTKSLPKQLKHFPKTRSIIDCTELFVQKSSLPSSQRVTWSQYKHHNTFKALVGISPTGAFTYISKLFTGSISDRRIVEESGYLEKLEYEDDVIADRGFLIRDLLAKRSATLNIPPSSMGKQMSRNDVTKTRRIASARIHVERAIGRLKTFKILQGVIPLKLHALLDQIIVICAVLCNLDSKLVKN